MNYNESFQIASTFLHSLRAQPSSSVISIYPSFSSPFVFPFFAFFFFFLSMCSTFFFSFSMLSPLQFLTFIFTFDNVSSFSVISFFLFLSISNYRISCKYGRGTEELFCNSDHKKTQNWDSILSLVEASIPFS